jgi:hypothetical protein
MARIIAWLEHLDRRTGHDRRYGVFIDELRVPITPQEHTKIVEPGDNALQLHAIDKKDRERNLVLADEIEKSVLEVLGAFGGHV